MLVLGWVTACENCDQNFENCNANCNINNEGDKNSNVLAGVIFHFPL